MMVNSSCDKCHLRPHAWFTDEGYLCNVCADDLRRRQAEAAYAARIERFREALMASHADRWSMEDIAEAAHICAVAERDQGSHSDGNRVPDELTRLRTAMAKINRLRSNVIATQNASWSNQMYPLVAILNEAGFEVEGATEEQKQEHLHCYGGAGGTPTLLDPTPYEQPPGRLQMPPTSGSVLIHAERWRQIEAEGWTAEHDAEHQDHELTRAAVCYAEASYGGTEVESPWDWPWDTSWWKPSPDPIRNLVKAGALIAAEIDRLSHKDGNRDA